MPGALCDGALLGDGGSAVGGCGVFFSCRVDDAQRHYFEDIDEYGYGYDRGGAVLAMLA